MSGTLGRLEFVTITRPEQIRDPSKQQVIRSRARHRDSGLVPKKRTRKLLQVTLDVPPTRVHSDQLAAVVTGGFEGSSGAQLKSQEDVTGAARGNGHTATTSDGLPDCSMMTLYDAHEEAVVRALRAMGSEQVVRLMDFCKHILA
jgi:hypothetical protein